MIFVHIFTLGYCFSLDLMYKSLYCTFVHDSRNNLSIIFTANDNFAAQITQIIDFSAITFLFVYLICSLAFLKVIFSSKENFSYYYLLIAIISIIFCVWVIYETPIKTLIIASSFTVAGIPLYYGWYKRHSRL